MGPAAAHHTMHSTHRLHAAAPPPPTKNETPRAGTSPAPPPTRPARLSARCKRNEVPIEKVFNKSLLNKFLWSMDVEPGFIF